MADFREDAKGVSNFITSPDFVLSVLIRNATEEQITACMEVCREQGRVINVYIQTETATVEWIQAVESIADTIIDAQKSEPVDYFNK